jgi:predicted AlkP superfamily phosphohydrolase/phosphomutase
VAAGQLPNFGRLLDRGATIDMATLKPTQAEPVWAAAATGKYPPKDGVRSAAVYRVRPDDPDPVDLLPDYCFAFALAYQGFVRAEEQTSASLRARPFWDILADYGLASGIVAWPLTDPAHAERGYVISDFFDNAASSPLRAADKEAGDPTTAVEIAREVFDAWQTRSWPEVLPAASPDEPPPDGWKDARWDRAYSAAAAELEQQFAPRLTALRFQALDGFAHTSLREAQPELFGELGRDEKRRSILDRYYTYIDGEIGSAIGQLEGNDLLLVVSGFGMDHETIQKRLLARVMGWPERSGTHESAPDGFLIAYGSNVARGQFARGAIVDLAPTVLYYMGLPVGRDMDGFARADLFLRSYALEHPVTYISTHER